MDAFYASIEQRDRPEYRNKPLAVGYAGERGVVAAASYEARKFGVRSAMPSKIAFRRCPHIIFVPARFDVYKKVSHQVRDIFLEYTDLVEPLSLDEAFLDVTVDYKNIRSGTLIAKEIRERIYKETGLTASAGVSYNKFLAKIASDENKPNGQFVITPDDTEAFLAKLPIERFFGVGKVTAERMHKMQVFNGYDLKMKSEAELVSAFGKAGYMYYLNARGIDDREVEPNRIRKSIGAENTFETNINSFDILCDYLHELSEEVVARVNKSSFAGRTVTIKVKYPDFRIITRSKTLPVTVNDLETLYNTGVELLSMVDISNSVRLLGISIKKPDRIEWKGDTQLEIDFLNT